MESKKIGTMSTNLLDMIKQSLYPQQQPSTDHFFAYLMLITYNDGTKTIGILSDPSPGGHGLKKSKILLEATGPSFDEAVTRLKDKLSKTNACPN